MPRLPRRDLVMTDRLGVEIDGCPHGRGVWLDPGERDELIERSAGGPAPRPAAMPERRERAEATRTRPESPLSELFGF